MHRDPHSHKGQNGIVAVVGGSRYLHGAPIFSALAAEASGVDLVFPCTPECHLETTKQASYNFIITPFRGCDLTKADVSVVEETIKRSNAAVIGPGLATFDTTQQAVETVIRNAEVPLVIDAGALQPWTFDALRDKTAVVTPHIRELSHMQGQVLEKRTHEQRRDIVHTIAKTRRVTIILKGPTDIIAGPNGELQEVAGGNAGLTVGGTGDALAGLIAGLIAQKVPPFEAAVMATTIIKRAATVLFHEKGYAFTTMDVISQMPHLVHTYEG